MWIGDALGVVRYAQARVKVLEELEDVLYRFTALGTRRWYLAIRLSRADSSPKL